MIKSLLCVAFLSASSAWSAEPALRGKVIGNYDGDTITVAINVRLAEIDAPELKQVYGTESRDLLSAILPANSAVTVRIGSIDRYGRLVGYVHDVRYPNGGYVNQVMVTAGAAWQYDGYSKDETYSASEESARYKNVGLWAKDDPVPPWVFRRKPVPNPFKKVQ